MSTDGRQDDALFMALLEVAPDTPEDFVPGTAAPPPVAEMASTASTRITAEVERPSPFDPEARFDTLAARQQQAAFLEREARHQTSALAAARSLLSASEAWAQLGDVHRATACATDAARAAPGFTLAQTQLRGLSPLATADDTARQAWLDCLQAEARLGGDEAARAHAALLLADLLRLSNDAAGASGAEEIARRAAPDDLRATVSQIGERLATGQNPLAVHLSAESPLRAAALGVAELRTGREAPQPGSTLLLERARRHLAEARRGPAAEALLEAAEQGVCTASLLDVAAALAAHDSSERPIALSALRRRLRLGASRPVLRTLAARALEQRDGAALNHALEAADPASGTFDLSERVVLSLLGGGSIDLRQLDLDALAEQRHPALAAAFAEDSGSYLQSTPTGLEAALGSQLAPARREELSLLLESFEGNSPVRQVLGAELALAARDADGAVRCLGHLAESLDLSEFYEAVGLIHEAEGHADRAADAYARAHELTPALRLVRALSDTSGSAPLVPLLSALARDATDPEQASLLWLEAALRAHPSESQELLERAARGQSLAPVVARYGAFLAARTADASRRRDWLSRGRELARGPVEPGVLLLWQAATGDGDALLGSVAELAARHPDDWALQVQSHALSRAALAQRARAGLDVSAAHETEAAWLAGWCALLAWRGGDLDLASEAARRLQRIAPSPFNRAFADMLADDGGDSTELSQRLLAEARGQEDLDARVESLERLAQLDQSQGDQAGAEEWRRALLAEAPDHRRTLAALERDLLADGRAELLEPIAGALASHLAPEDGIAYRHWLGAGRLLDGDLRAARRWLEPVARSKDATEMALRAVEIHARQVDDAEALLSVGEGLTASARGSNDACTQALQTAFALVRLGRRAEALAFVDTALRARPHDLVAVWLRGELLEAVGLYALAAQTFQELASRLRVDPQRVAASFHAGQLWRQAGEAAESNEQAERAFSEVLRLDPHHTQAFAALRQLVAERGDTRALVDLYEARAERATDRAEQIDLCRSLAQCFHALSETARERAVLERWMELEPEAAPPCKAHAQACTALGEYEVAKSSWLRFLAHPLDTASRGRAQLALAILYDEHLEDAAAAALAYEEVLAQRPGDLDVLSRLVRSYGRVGAADRAIALQTKLIQLAPSPQDKRDGALRLARLYETLAGDTKRAAATLERTRKAYPLDPAPLAALARFMERHGEAGASRMLVERAVKEIWRKLESERVEPGLLEMLATLADLQGHDELARCTHAAHQAWLGEPDELEGALAAALGEQLDDLLAPAEMSAPLRTLLRKTSRALDVAFPIDPGAIAATPVSSGEIYSELERLSHDCGLGAVELYVTPQLGARCLPGHGSLGPSRPHQVLMGPKLAELRGPARTFLLLRALKLQKTGAGALARSRSEDTWPMLAALLHLFAPNWTPAGVDQQKFLLARPQVEKGLRAAGYDDDVPFLVLEAIGTLSQRAHHMGEAARLLSDRAALLGSASLEAAFQAFAHVAGRPLAAGGPGRWRWLNGHPEARDLALFCASNAHAQARQRLGLATESLAAASRVQSLPPRPPQRSLPGLAASLPPRPPPRRGH